jgi:LmbE family N-acetylglucosaminyl deacetylase
MKMKKILIIAPHADDDALGFGGYLIDQIAEGAEVHVRIGTIGGKHRLQNYENRMEEFKNAMRFIGVPDDNRNFYFKNFDAEMDTIPIRDIATLIDNDFDTIKPDEVFCCASSTHQDHIQMYNAFMVSMRLRDGFMPSFVALGEYPFILTSYDYPNGGKFYHPLSPKTLEKKIEYFLHYKSQVKPKPSPLGEVGIKMLAKTRGFECGHDYAELFYIQKLIR